VTVESGIQTIGRPQREVFGSTLAEIASMNARIIVLDGDLANSTRADIFAVAHRSRFLQMGIAEQGMLGVAAGLSTMGWIPFVSTFACFAVCRALDPIRVLVAQPSLNVKIAAGYSGLLTGLTGKTHQALNDMSIMRSIPHVVILSPGDDVETDRAVRVAAEIDGPVYIRLARDAGPNLFGPDYQFVLGRAHLLRNGGDVGIVATGSQTSRAVEAAALLAESGVDASVLHVPTVKPLDEEAIVALARRVGLIVTTEEHAVIGGLGGAVAELLARRYPVPVLRHGVDDVFGESAPNEDLLERYRLAPGWLAALVRGFVNELGTRPD
jgi:transketolase